MFRSISRLLTPSRPFLSLPKPPTKIIPVRFLSTMPSPPKLQNIAIDTDSDAIAIVKFNRPKNANALNTDVIKDMLSALQWAESEDKIRVIVTTGEGKFYTAGLDLLDPAVKQPGATISDEFADTLGLVHEQLINTNKLVISAVNGPAPGWGTTSIALSDLIYSVPDAIFFTPFVQWGLNAEGVSSLTFTRIMGRQKASALILGGARMTAQELETAGLVTKILPKENFFNDVLGIARGIAKLPPKSLTINKELMMRGLREDLLQTNKVELKLLKSQARGKESLEAIDGFAKETERKKKKQKGSKL